MRAKEPAIARAIAKLGGKVAAAKTIGVSFTTLHAWDNQGFIKDIAWALRVAELSDIELEEFALDARKGLGRK